MFDFFTILSKGGIVLWYIQGTKCDFLNSINTLIKSIVFSDRQGSDAFICNDIALKYHLDNEFKLIYVVGYQKILQLSYVDKFLSSIELKFRDLYKNSLGKNDVFLLYHTINFPANNLKFLDSYSELLSKIESQAKFESTQPKEMRSFDQSTKSKKKISSMIVNKSAKSAENEHSVKVKAPSAVDCKSSITQNGDKSPNLKEVSHPGEEIDLTAIKREEFIKKMNNPKKKNTVMESNIQTTKSPKVKKPTKWAGANPSSLEAACLDYSNRSSSEKNHPNMKSNTSHNHAKNDSLTQSEMHHLTSLREQIITSDGQLAQIEVETDSESSEEEDIPNSDSNGTGAKSVTSSGSSRGGMMSLFKNLVFMNNKLTTESMQPVLLTLRDRLVEKNVAAEVATKLCDSVSEKLSGQTLGTFERVKSKVKSGLEESVTQLLQPDRSIDILRDIIKCKNSGQPYVIVFCGVNGVGKSTNLAKIAFWLLQQNLRVLIVAGDTFRAGSVEQLRVHVTRLNYIYPSNDNVTCVELFERGYGKDAANIALSGVIYARESKFDVVLIDTAGRMQNNQPLMQSLSKLIKINQPNLVLFVGEALVGNEAVDQLVKFNQALVDNSIDESRSIDGIVLTKFDTIDDKVGAAVSMTYISKQPILFVGTGQTYADLRQLSPSAVVKALMK